MQSSYTQRTGIYSLWNKRDYHFGGESSRILVGLRQYLSSYFRILIEMDGHDVAPGGVTVDSTAKTAKMDEADGVDATEISGGSLTPSSMTR